VEAAISCVEDGLMILADLTVPFALHLKKYAAYAGRVDNTILQDTTVDANGETMRSSGSMPEAVFVI